MAEKQEETGATAVVTRDVPLLEVEILDGVHARIDGELVEPGDTAWVDGACAVNLLSLGHAKIVGSA